MGRQFEHQKHHQDERAQKRDERKQHEHAQEKQVRSIHPGWLGVVLVGAALMLWTFI